MAHFNPDDTSRFDPFHVLTTPYKTVDGHDITLNVLYPKALDQSPPSGSEGCPIVIRFHGGGLGAGASMFPDFFGRWLLELAERHSALIVSADYRLLPESNVGDVLDDVEDFWQWLHAELPSFLRAETAGKIKPDLNRIMTAGESAGGYLSIQLSLSHPDMIRATTAAYPMVDIAGPYFTEKFPKQLLEVPQMPENLIDDHLAKAKANGSQKPAVVSSDPRLERAPIMFAVIQQGLFKDYLDPADSRQVPLTRLDNARLPSGGVFVWHGADDTLVPVEGSQKFAAKVAERYPDLPFTLAIQPGEHGFDAETKIDEDWMSSGLRPLVKAWLD
jgi:acetyl esterase/lipase